MQRPIIFLDIDGVLNDGTYCGYSDSCAIQKDKVFWLNTLLQFTEAQIVISSAWRYLVHNGYMTLKGFDAMMRTHGLQKDRVIDVTRIDTPVPSYRRKDGKIRSNLENERGPQIRDWLNLHPEVTRFVAIDDHDAGITSSGVPLVRTETKIGLTPDNVEQAAFTLVDEKYIASPGMIDYAKRMIPQVQRVAP